MLVDYVNWPTKPFFREGKSIVKINNPQFEAINRLANDYANNPLGLLSGLGNERILGLILQPNNDHFYKTYELIENLDSKLKTKSDVDHFASQFIGGLSSPGKMPWFSWSTPIAFCDTGSKLALIDDSVCNKCYANKGNYHRPNVKHSLLKRWIMYRIGGGLWYKCFDAIFSFYESQLKSNDQLFFRWFDSGDLINAKQLVWIKLLAKKHSKIRFWLPTKELKMIKQCRVTIPDNLIIRYSTPMVGTLSKMDNSTMAFNEGKEFEMPSNCSICPATINPDDHTCKGNNCNSCWFSGHIAYRVH